MSRLTIPLILIHFFGFCYVFGREKEQLRSEIKRKVKAFTQLPMCEKIRVHDSVFSCLEKIDPMERDSYDGTLNYPFQLLTVMEKTTGTKCNIFNPIGHFMDTNNKYGFSYLERDLDKDVSSWSRRYGCVGYVSLSKKSDSLYSMLDVMCKKENGTDDVVILYVRLENRSVLHDSLTHKKYTSNLLRVYSGDLCFLRNLRSAYVSVKSDGENTMTQCNYYKVYLSRSLEPIPVVKVTKPESDVEDLFSGGKSSINEREIVNTPQYEIKLMLYEQIDKKDIPNEVK